ncbi:MAG: endopeptidase La [Anaerolineae bacterium]|nr:endopeptidase La [Anaerolineae bacterium]
MSQSNDTSAPALEPEEGGGAAGELETVEEAVLSEEEPTEDQPAEPVELGVLVSDMVVFPATVRPLGIADPAKVRLVDEAVVNRRPVLVVLRHGDQDEDHDLTPEDLHSVGSTVMVARMIRQPDGTLRLMVQGMERYRIIEVLEMEPYPKVLAEPIPEAVEDDVETRALARNVVSQFQRLVSLVPYLPEELSVAAMNVDDNRQLAYLVATSAQMQPEDAQTILEMDSIKEKLRRLTEVLSGELEVLELGRKIQSEAQSEMEKTQREYFLRQQLKAIQKELGEADEQTAEVERLRELIEEAALPEEAAREAERELSRLASLPSAAAEYGVIRSYLEWLAGLPWSVTTEDRLDLEHARQVLDEDHYDLEKIKDRIIEYLAVRKLRSERKQEEEPEGPSSDKIRREREGAILCFVGPPGVGKTSLGRSIARAMGREFIRTSLGGLHDESEIRGHRRTYIGAMPGRIIQALRRVGTRNPVMMLDEVDKLGRDFRGDPASALLEVLDPEQNVEFRDNYLDVPFDLSQVLFITTANLLDPVPEPLRDRMEILQLDGYTEEEKLHIARLYLVRRQLLENGLREGELAFDDEALRTIIRRYTREAGVRELERRIGAVARRVAVEVGAGRSDGLTSVKAEDVAGYLGKPVYFQESAERTQVPGVATGLVVTYAGGDITFIEAARMTGDGRMTLTGQLGEVMRESAQAALTYVRSHAEELGVDEELVRKSDLHIHVPAGAVPKDGPSAGVTMTAALVSLFSGRPISGDVAMTGEVTLRGQVLPVGGIKQKVLAAHRAGLSTVVLPTRNEKDLDDIPASVREQMRIVLVDRVEDALATALSTGS